MSDPTEIHALQVVDPAAEPGGLLAQQSAGIVRAAAGDVTEAFCEYKRIQAALDRMLPDCIQTIQGKKFRKKAFWRAVATAFNIHLEFRSEQRLPWGAETGREGWLWTATYRAIAPNGRYADGDGTCEASEKTVYLVEWGAGRGPRVVADAGRPLVDLPATALNASAHNVRAHAHTRAKNRAIADLVGFGEVSAEELPLRDVEGERAPQRRGQPGERREPPPNGPRTAPAGATPDALAQKLGFGKFKNLSRSEEHTSELQSRLHLVFRL